MATSTNYGWSEPDNTSLVKDGALAIRTLGNAIDTSLWNSGYGQAGKNALINGAFDIWQRGTSFTNPSSSGAYNADRWCSYFNGNGTITQETTVKPDTSTYSLKMTATATSADNAIFQLIEQLVMQRFRGKTVTLSVKLAGTATVTPAIRLTYSTTANDNLINTSTNITATNVIAPTINPSTFVTYSSTFAVPTTAKTLRIGILSNSVINTNVLYIAETQLEYGTLATPFQTASGGSIQGELAMCQRYYQKSFAQGTAPATNAGRTGAVENFAIRAAGALGISFVRFPVIMRGTPTVTIFNPSAANNQARNLDTGSDCSSTTAEAQTDSSFRYYYTLPLTSISTNLISAQYEASAEL